MSYNYNSDLLRETEELLSKKSTESSDNVSNNAEYNNIDTKHRFNTTIEAKNGKEDESNNGDIVPEEVIKKSFSKIGNREIGVSSNYESPQLPVTLDSTSPNFYGVEYIDSSTTFRVSDIQENDNGKTISSNFGSGIPDSKKYEADIDSTESALISAVNDYNAATENDGVVLTSTYEQTTSPQSTEEILKQDVSDTIETNINNEHSDLTLEKISNRRHNLTITETRENKENPIQSSSVFIVNEDYAITTETNINNEHLEFTPEDISNRRHNLAIIKTKTLEKSNENVDGGIPRSQNKEGTIESSLVSPINEDYTVTEKNGTVLTLPYEKPTSEQSIAEIFKQDVSEIPTILSWLPAVENSTTENDTTEANINKEHSDSILEEISDRRHNLTVIRTGTLEKSNENFDDGVSNSEKDSIRSASMSAVNENNAVTENDGVVLTSIYEQPTTQQSTAIVFKQEVTENSTILSRSIASDHSETENDTIETSSNNEHEKPNSQQFSAGVFKQDNPTILSWPTTVEDFTTESSTNTEHSAVTFEEINDRRHNLTIIRDETFEKNKENEITWNSFDSGVATKIKIYENNETSEDVQENTTLVDNLGREVVHTFDKPLTKNSEEATWTTNIVHPITTASNDDTTEESIENISTTVKIIQAGKENISNNSDTTDEDEIPQYSFPTEKEEIDYMETTTSILNQEIINHFANKYEESTTEELILITKIDNDDNNGLKNNETEEDLSKKGEDYEATRATPYEVNSKAYDFNEKEETDSMESTEISTEKIMSTTEDDSKIYRDENNENNDNVVKSSEAVVEGNGLLAENHENFNIVNQINLKEINESTSKRTETLIEEVDSATLTQAEINNFTDIRDSTTETVISTTEIESKTSTEALSSEDFSKITGDNIENFNDITTINKLGTITSEQFQDSSEENYSYFNENEEIDSVESTRRVPTNEKPTHFRNSINESATDEIISTTEFDTEISTKALINEDFSKVTENVIETFSEVTVKNKVDIVTTETFLDSNTYNYLYSNKEEKIDLVENTSILIKEEITDHSTVSIKDSTTEEITSTIETGSEIYTETVNNDNLSKVTENIVRSITDMTVQNKVDMVKTEESTVQTTEAFTFNIAGNADKVTNPIFSESESAETTTENNLREPVTSSTDKVNDPVENNFTYVVHATGAIKTTTIPSLDDIEVEVAIENTINDIRNATRTLVTALTVEEETEGTEDYSSDRITHIRDHLEESSESDIEFEAAKEKILKDINNITRTLVTALRAEEETEETENDSSDTVTRDYSEESLESEDYSTAISSSEEEQEEEENDMNLNVLDAFLSNLIPASKTTVDPTSVSDQNGYDQETENGVERLHANVFGNQANVTIKIEVKVSIILYCACNLFYMNWNCSFPLFSGCFILYSFRCLFQPGFG